MVPVRCGRREVLRKGGPGGKEEETGGGCDEHWEGNVGEK